jgi:mutual gliding-motility protein MglA
MPHINAQRREITFKVVYYGPALSGKTTNLQRIHRKLDERLKGELLVLDTDEERTLFFDFFPLDLGRIDEYSVRFHLYTVPGQVYYEASRRLILNGADGVVFVADSSPERYEANLVSFTMMLDNLRSYGRRPEEFPLVLQVNKRDLADRVPMGSLERDLPCDGVPVFEAVALEGIGVMETIRELSRELVGKFQL